MPYVAQNDRVVLDPKIEELAKAICDVAIPYGYDGAFAGELNYSITRLIQRIPQIMVERGVWKEEIRYWILAITKGVLTDVLEEYRRRVSNAYEAFQIVKSGDCYDTTYRTVLTELVPDSKEYLELMKKFEKKPRD